MSETVTKPVVAHRAALDFLNGCEYNCKGCFVDKTNTCTDEDLQLLYELMIDVNSNGMLFDELVLGPVDLFGSSNGYDIITHPTFVRIMNECKPILAMPITAMAPIEIVDKFIDGFNELYSPYTELEFQIIINPAKLAARDITYIEQIKRTILQLNRIVPRVCYAMQMNVRSLKGIDLVDLYDFVKSQFHTIIDIAPSFFRSQDGNIIWKMNQLWVEELERVVNDDNKLSVNFPSADHTHDGHQYFNWYWKDKQIYISPFINEKVVVTDAQFAVPKIDGKFTSRGLNEFAMAARYNQYAIAHKMDDCSSCRYLHMCIGRHVLQYMNFHQKTSCVLPRKVLDLYELGNYGEMAMPNGIYDWTGYSPQDEIIHGNRKHHEFAQGKGILSDVTDWWIEDINGSDNQSN